MESRDVQTTLRCFLENGTSVQERGRDGLTCLHVALTLLTTLPRDQDWQRLLEFLIDRGADVHAETQSGISVSHVAYFRSCWDKEPCSLPGDLWDSVLDACNYDIREFRKGYPRTAGYTPDYTRSDFEALWKGREERCPYWDEAFWFSPIDGGGIGDGSGPLCHCVGAAYLSEYCTKERDTATNGFSYSKASSSEGESGDDEEEEEEEEEGEREDGDEEAEESGKNEEEDQDNRTREPLVLSQEWTDPDPSPGPSLNSESGHGLERPFRTMTSSLEGSGADAQAYSWGSTLQLQYGSVFSNPWLGD